MARHERERKLERCEANFTPTADTMILKTLQDISEQLKKQVEKPPPRYHRTNCRNHYCWSHGKCGHRSDECRAKKPGHKDQATLQNKMGGSQRGCNPQE